METRNQELEALNESLSQRIEVMNEDFRRLSEQEDVKREALLIQEEHATMVEELKEMLEEAKRVATSSEANKRELENICEGLKEERDKSRREKEAL